MRLEIALPRTVLLGEPVSITLRLTNPGPKRVTAYLSGRPPAFDILITRPDGTPVWRRLRGAMTSAILELRVLGPHETAEFTDTWNQRDQDGGPIAPGEYRITGILPVDPPEELRTRAAPLRISDAPP